MSNEAVGWVWKFSPYTGAQLLVHLAVADVVNDLHGYEFWMSTDSLARKAKVSRSTVVATLRDMAARGLLQVLKSGEASRTPSRYRFVAVDNETASATTALSSAIWPSPLARPPRTNSKDTKRTKSASALTALVDCPQCQGRGFFFNATAGCDAACPCTRVEESA